MARNPALVAAYAAYNRRDNDALKAIVLSTIASQDAGTHISRTTLRTLDNLIVGIRKPLTAPKAEKASKRFRANGDILATRVVHYDDKLLEISYHATKGYRLKSLPAGG